MTDVETRREHALVDLAVSARHGPPPNTRSAPRPGVAVGPAVSCSALTAPLAEPVEMRGNRALPQLTLTAEGGKAVNRPKVWAKLPSTRGPNAERI